MSALPQRSVVGSPNTRTTTAGGIAVNPNEVLELGPVPHLEEKALAVDSVRDAPGAIPPDGLVSPTSMSARKTRFVWSRAAARGALTD